MFELVSDESSQNLGIEVYKKRLYAFNSLLLSGSVMHDSTHKSYCVMIAPNYSRMAEMAEPKKDLPLHLEFDKARSHSVVLGSYRSLDIIDAAIHALEDHYIAVLKKTGANQRFLVEEGNSLLLVSNDDASPLRYTEAIIRARNIQAFHMMRENKELDYVTVVGKIMPIFLHALGLKEYHLSHDLSEDGNGEVKFIIENVGIFAFYKPEKENGPAYFERYSYLNGDYQRSFSGETRGDIMKKFVFEWLVGAAREKDSILRDDFDAYLDELAQDVRRTCVEPKSDEPKTLIYEPLKLIQPDNVVQMAAFRPS